MALLKTKKPLVGEIVVSRNKTISCEIISIKEAAQRLGISISNVEYHLVNDRGSGTTLDFTYPFEHNGPRSGLKCIVVNEKFLQLEKKQ